MDLQLFSIKRAPRDLPIWETILADLGNPDAKGIAKALGVSVKTVYRWHQIGRAPRSAMLALFWMTRWGYSLVNASATNDAILYAQFARSLQREIAAHKSRLDTITRDRDALRLRVVKMTALIVGDGPQEPLSDHDRQCAEEDAERIAQWDAEDEAEREDSLVLGTLRKVLLVPSGRKPAPGSRIVRLLDREPAAAREVAKDMGVSLKTVSRLERRQQRLAKQEREGQEYRNGTYRTVLLTQSDEDAAADGLGPHHRDRRSAGTATSEADVGTLPGSSLAGQVQVRTSAARSEHRQIDGGHRGQPGQRAHGWGMNEAAEAAETALAGIHRSAGSPDVARPGTPASATRLRRSLGASPQPPMPATGHSAFSALVAGAIAQGSTGKPPTTRPSAISTRYAPLANNAEPAAKSSLNDQEDA